MQLTINHLLVRHANALEGVPDYEALLYKLSRHVLVCNRVSACAIVFACNCADVIVHHAQGAQQGFQPAVCQVIMRPRAMNVLLRVFAIDDALHRCREHQTRGSSEQGCKKGSATQSRCFRTFRRAVTALTLLL